MSKYSQEIWISDLTPSRPNELAVNNGAYRMILKAYPSRGVVISNSSVDCRGRPLPPYARLLTILLPTGGPNIYNATVQLTEELEGRVAVCDEIVFTVTINLPGGNQGHYHQNGKVFYIEYPLPKLKLAGVLKHPYAWDIIMRFENLSDNGQYLLYRRHRKSLEKWAKTRPQYQDLVAMVLNEEGVACLIRHRLKEGVNLAKKACPLSSFHNCVNDRTIRGYASAVYAAAERFGGNQDGAKQHLQDALEIFDPMEPSSYTSITLYNVGAIAMERSATVGVSNSEEKEAESFLQKAAMHWNHQSLNKTARMLPRVYNRLIGLYLKSSPNSAPNLNVTVSQDNLRRAGEVIRRFGVLLPECSKWMKSTFYLGKADHWIRTRDIDNGLRAAQQALDISRQSGLQREAAGATSRVNLLRELDDLRRRPPIVPDCMS
ncbi:uncharacterized protein LOC111321654 isoform X2 [Stylophora pistillata]|nr:uncharacterized protein LOC111321654 isoform X2 [Stylophora pistillata]